MNTDKRRFVLLIHWNAEEARERCELLLGAGFDSSVFSPQGMSSLRNLRDRPPDAFVIDLGRMPSHGRAVATALRQQKATRSIPIVFVEGDPGKVARIRETLPDATYTGWGNIGSALREAILNPPQKPAGTALRRSLDQWFDRRSIRPRIVADIADGALLKVFGATGAGLFPAPAAIEKDIRRQYGVRPLGTLDGVRERFYAISVERKLKNPAVLAISSSARTELFA